MERPFVDQFGFDVVTCCGYLPQVSKPARTRWEAQPRSLSLC